MTVGRSTAKTHCVGAAFEDKAAVYLQAQGLNLLVQNWHVARVGELDVVMLDDTGAQPELVFVEVKRRASKAFGGVAASITPAKQRKIAKTASAFLAAHERFAQLPCRFDVVVFEGGQVRWHKAAFCIEG